MVCVCTLQTMKKQPRSLLQQQIMKKCAENKNAKACLCIKVDQNFFENNLYISNCSVLKNRPHYVYLQSPEKSL